MKFKYVLKIEKQMLEEFSTLFEDFTISKSKKVLYKSRLHIDKREPTNTKNKGPRTLALTTEKGGYGVYDRDASPTFYWPIDFYALRKSLNRAQAEEELAARYGIDPTRDMTPGEYAMYKEAQERQAKLKDWLSKAQAELEGDAATAAQARQYAEGRGWDADFRKQGGLFLADQLTIGQLLQIVEGMKTSPKAAGIGTTHTIGIPYYTNGGKLVGFSFRDTSGTAQGGQKYLNFALSDKGLNGTYLFDITPARKDCIAIALVEGAADTIRAQMAVNAVRARISSEAEAKEEQAKDLRTHLRFMAEGEEREASRQQARALEAQAKALRKQADALPEVAGMGTDTISEKHAAQLKKMGYSKVVVMTDTEGAGGDQNTNNEQRRKALGALYDAGLEAYAAVFPQAYDEDGNAMKVDADAFLRSDTEEGKCSRAEAFVDLITAQRETGWAWIRDTFITPKYEDKDLLEDTEARDDYARELLRLAAQLPPLDRDPLLTQAEEMTGRQIRADSLRAFLEAEDATANKAKAKDTLQKGMTAAQEEKDVEDALLAITDATEKASRILTKATNEAKTVSAINLDFWQSWAEAPEAIDTQYFTFDSNGEPTRLTLRSSALSFVCASSNHGKTQLLVNLAVGALRNGHKVAFISYEEATREITKYFANIAANVELSKNNRRTINSMAKARTQQELLAYVRSSDGTAPEKVVEAFYNGASEMEQASREKRLIVRDTGERVGELCSWIKYARAEVGTEVFFIDYIQIVPPDMNAKDNRKADITAVCQALRRTAIESGAAIVLAAQLNRTAHGIEDAEAGTIADASDINHVADLVVWMRSSLFRDRSFYSAFPEKKPQQQEEQTPKNRENAWFKDRGYNPDDKKLGASIFVRIIKSRGNRDVGNTAILPFNGNTGRIEPEPYRLHPHPKAMLQGAAREFAHADAYDGWIIPKNAAQQEQEAATARIQAAEDAAREAPPTDMTLPF